MLSVITMNATMQYGLFSCVFKAESRSAAWCKPML